MWLRKFFACLRYVFRGPPPAKMPDGPFRIAGLDEILALPELAMSLSAIQWALTPIAVLDFTMPVFSQPQKNLVYLDLFRRDVNNGGFWQFFSNTGGDFYEECLTALKEIGRDDVADLLRAAGKVFTDGPVSKDQVERQRQMADAEKADKDGTFWKWDTVDTLYYDRDVDLVPNIIDYVILNRSEF